MKGASLLLICFAVKEESRPFERLVMNHSGMEILLTGMGQRNAECALRLRLRQNSPAAVISSGFAGGLNPDLMRGNIVFDADNDFPLAAALRKAGAREARFHCSPSVVITAADKQLLWETLRADAVEMESSVIRTVCREQGIPSATVRVISDTAQESLPLDFNRLLTEDLEMDYGKLSLAMLKAPGKVGELLRFQQKIRAAANRLARVLADALAGLSHQ